MGGGGPARRCRTRCAAEDKFSAPTLLRERCQLRLHVYPVTVTRAGIGRVVPEASSDS